MRKVFLSIVITVLFFGIAGSIYAAEGTLTFQGGVGIPETDIDDQRVMKGAWGLSYDAWLTDDLGFGINPYFTNLEGSSGLNKFNSAIEGIDLYLKYRPTKGLALNFNTRSVINRISPFVAVGIGAAHHGSRGYYDADNNPATDNTFRRNKYMMVLPHLAAGLSMRTKWQFNIDLGVKFNYTNTDLIDNFDNADWKDGYYMPYIGIGLKTGRPSDRDGDGIPDKLDGAPNHPEDFDGFMDSDGIPDPDNDGDGIPDIRDGAPNEAEDFDGFQDSDGIPDPDNDNDGIPDVRDLAPGTDETVRLGIDTKETYNNYQDEDGVPDTIPETPKPETPKPETPKPGTTDSSSQNVPETDQIVNFGKEYTLPVVYFETNYYAISAADKLLLDALAAGLKKYPQVRLLVQGHTDSTGPMSINTPLAVNRAKAVKNYLVNKGIAASRLEVKGFGPDNPVDTNATVEGRSNNRRTDFSIIQ